MGLDGIYSHYLFQFRQCHKGFTVMTETTPFETATMRDPKRWAVFTWFCDNGLPPPVESEISDFLDRIDNAQT